MLVLRFFTPFLKTPISIGIILITQTILITTLINKLIQSSWFIIITFLIIIGGLLIIFIYIRRIASNEKFKLKINLFLITIIIIIYLDEIILENQTNENQNLFFQRNNDLTLIKIYNSKSIIVTIILVIYLLITIISVSKIVKHYKGPLRAFKNKYE